MDPSDGSCHHSCDWAHCGDRYTNITSNPRSSEGYNKQVMKKITKDPDVRVVVCGDCSTNGTEDECDKRETCGPCQRRAKKDGISN